MKVLILLVALVAVVYADFTPQSFSDLKKYRSECIESLKLTEEAVNAYKTNNYPDEENVRCYLKCVLTKMNLFDDTTGFNADNLVTQMSTDGNEKEVREEVTRCIDPNTDKVDACAWAYRGYICFHKSRADWISASLRKH